jgi:signal transduction histidine kinase
MGTNEARKYIDGLSNFILLGKLTSYLLHEFNNSFQVILGFSQNLQESLPPGSDGYEDISTVIEEAKKCCELTQKLNLLETSISGELQDLGKILEILENFFSQKIAKKKLQVQIMIPPNFSLVNKANAAYIAILNLFFFALDKSKESSLLTIHSSCLQKTCLHINFVPKNVVEPDIFNLKNFLNLFDFVLKYEQKESTVYTQLTFKVEP